MSNASSSTPIARLLMTDVRFAVVKKILSFITGDPKLSLTTLNSGLLAFYAILATLNGTRSLVYDIRKDHPRKDGPPWLNLGSQADYLLDATLSTPTEMGDVLPRMSDQERLKR